MTTTPLPAGHDGRANPAGPGTRHDQTGHDGRANPARLLGNPAARLLGVVLVVLALAACTGGNDAADDTTADEGTSSTTEDDGSASDQSEESARPADPAPTDTVGAPAVGACLEPLTYDLAEAAPLPTLVPCDEPHGGEVIAVYELPEGPYPGISSEAGALDASADACFGSDDDPQNPDDAGDFGEFAGDNRLESPESGDIASGDHPAWRVSSLEGTLYVPRPSAWNRGERWVACAAVLKNTTVALASYEGSAQGVFGDGDLPPEFGWCRTAGDQQSGRFDLVDCREPHAVEQVASFTVAPDDTQFPGNDPIDDLASRLCPGLARVATDGAYTEDTDQIGLSWTFPTENEWADGDRTGRCYINQLQDQSTGAFGTNAE